MSHKWVTSNHIAIFNACAIGLAAGSAATVLTQGVSWIGAWRLHLAGQYGAWIVLPAFGGIGGLIAGLLISKYPNASGSGIPQVKASLLGQEPQGLDIRTAMMKLIGGLIAIGSGLLMGREGPTVHVGAALSTEINRRARSDAGKERLLVAAGAGAGLAAAFNAPLAGVFFVLEELLKDISSSTIGTAVLACFVASVASHLLHGDESVRHIAANAVGATFSALEIPAYLLVGVTAGIFGAFFNKCVMVCLRFNRDIFKAPIAVRVCAAGIVSGLLVAALPQHFHNYAGMREHIVYGDLAIHSAAIAFVIFFALTVIAYGSGAPGGLFAPALAMGSCIGHVFGLLQHYIQPNVQMDTFALVGMGAMFASVARVPITAIVIVFEMTQNFEIVLPLMLGCIVASSVADRLYAGSIYDRLIEWSGLMPVEVKAPPQSSAEERTCTDNCAETSSE
jgi:CIC family chloride channel protein